jgi:hypothetical protein
MTVVGVALILIAAAGAFALAATVGDDAPSDGPADGVVTTLGPGGTSSLPQPGSTTEGTGPSGTDVPGSESAIPRPLGSVAASSTPVRECPEGMTCASYDVTCPGVGTAAGVELATGPAAGSTTGVAVLFSGGAGDQWWDGGQPEALGAIGDLRQAGVEVVEVRWPGGWSNDPSGNGPGLAALACRSASVLRFVHDQRYAPLGLGHTPGRCGFCASGNSAGASQVAFSLARYGLDSIIDVAVLSGGPPHAALARGCLHEQGDEAFWYDDSQVRDIDAAYAQRGGGPCQRHDGSFSSYWDRDDPASSSGDLAYETRVAIVLGGRDTTIAPAHARVYLDALQAAGSPSVEEVDVPTSGHRIEHSVDGVAAVRDLILGR